jgi:hypothetical protein
MTVRGRESASARARARCTRAAATAIASFARTRRQESRRSSGRAFSGCRSFKRSGWRCALGATRRGEGKTRFEAAADPRGAREGQPKFRRASDGALSDDPEEAARSPKALALPQRLAQARPDRASTRASRGSDGSLHLRARVRLARVILRITCTGVRFWRSRHECAKDPVGRPVVSSRRTRTARLCSASSARPLICPANGPKHTPESENAVDVTSVAASSPSNGARVSPGTNAPYPPRSRAACYTPFRERRDGACLI